MSCGSGNAEPPDGAGLGELLRQIGQGLFQRAGVNAARGDGFPSGFPVAASQGVHAGGGHFGLDGILNGVDRGGQLVSHAAQLPQLVDLGIKILVSIVCTSVHFVGVGQRRKCIAPTVSGLFARMSAARLWLV